PITLDPKEGSPTVETARKIAESPEFQAGKKKAIDAGRAAMAAAVKRIETVLTESQRDDYHKLVGPPFDLSTIEREGEDTRQEDVGLVAQALGLGGQQSDPTFNTKVANPAYASGPRHPKILFDEAHHNFHTAGGRYKPFAELMRSDGYEV